MKRRNFLMALIALPFAPKVLTAKPWVPRSAKMTPEEWTRHIEHLVDEKMKELNATNWFAVEQNTISLRQSPTGWKK